jgi:hypothetical protein
MRSGCNSGWDTPLSTLSPVLGRVTTPATWVPEVLLHAVYVLNWHMLGASEIHTCTFTAIYLAVQAVGRSCLRYGSEQWH